MQETVPEGECIVAPPIGEIPKGGRWRLAFDVQVPVSAGSDCAPRPEKTPDETPGQTAVGITEAQSQPGPCLLESRLHSVERVALHG